jgi:hypothetical protein
MTAEDEFRALLAGHAPLAALVGNRIAQHAISEGQKPPLVVFNATHAPEYGVGGGLLCDEIDFTVQCWGMTALQAEQVAAAVRGACAAAPGTRYCAVMGERGTFDSELQLDGVELTVEWTHPPT